jgi:hypothetical protein
MVWTLKSLALAKQKGFKQAYMKDKSSVRMQSTKQNKQQLQGSLQDKRLHLPRSENES